MTLFWPPEMGSWVWNGVSMIWPGGTPMNLEVLWARAEAELANHAQPGVDGLLERDSYRGQLVAPVDYLLSALVLPDGSPATNPGYAIDANYAELLDRVGEPATWPTRGGVDTAVVTPSGVSRTGRAQGVVSPLGARVGSVGTAVVTVTIPSGMLDVTGS